MHCPPKSHWIPTVSAVTSLGFSRALWAGASILLYAPAMIEREYFSDRPAYCLIPELAAVACIHFFPAEQSAILHYMGVVGALLTGLYDFACEGKPWKLLLASMAVALVSMALHELACVPFALDVFALIEWPSVIAIVWLRSQPAKVRLHDRNKSR